MATMLVNKEYGGTQQVEQVCRQCGARVEWLKKGKIWSPTNPSTGKFHVCKEALNGKNTN